MLGRRDVQADRLVSLHRCFDPALECWLINRDRHHRPSEGGEGFSALPARSQGSADHEAGCGPGQCPDQPGDEESRRGSTSRR